MIVISVVDFAFVLLGSSVPVFFFIFTFMCIRLLQIGNTTDRKLKVPVYVVAQKPCVQVSPRSGKSWVSSAGASSHSPSAFSAGVAVVPTFGWQEDSVPRL